MTGFGFPLVAPWLRSAYYLHLHSSVDQPFDLGAGPFPSLGSLCSVPGIDIEALNSLAPESHSRITRFDLGALAQDSAAVAKALDFIAYEQPSLAEAETTNAQRIRVDDQIVLHPMTDKALALAAKARHAFGEAIRLLFSSTLCSMRRIVLTACWADEPEVIAVTVRDVEKRPGQGVGIALITKGEGSLYRAYVDPGETVTSSAIMAWYFHQLMGPGHLIHAHLLAPVLVDGPFEGVGVIAESPRTTRFAQSLVELFGSGHACVLRKGEGIWSHDLDMKRCLANIIKCQERSLDLLTAMPLRWGQLSVAGQQSD